MRDRVGELDTLEASIKIRENASGRTPSQNWSIGYRSNGVEKMNRTGVKRGYSEYSHDRERKQWNYNPFSSGDTFVYGNTSSRSSTMAYMVGNTTYFTMVDNTSEAEAKKNGSRWVRMDGSQKMDGGSVTEKYVPTLNLLNYSENTDVSEKGGNYVVEFDVNTSEMDMNPKRSQTPGELKIGNLNSFSSVSSDVTSKYGPGYHNFTGKLWIDKGTNNPVKNRYSFTVKDSSSNSSRNITVHKSWTASLTKLNDRVPIDLPETVEKDARNFSLESSVQEGGTAKTSYNVTPDGIKINLDEKGPELDYVTVLVRGNDTDTGKIRLREAGDYALINSTGIHGSGDTEVVNSFQGLSEGDNMTVRTFKGGVSPQNWMGGYRTRYKES